MSANGECHGCGAGCGGNVCCDPCWDRIPTRLTVDAASAYGGGVIAWRSALRRAQRNYNWPLVEAIFDAVKAWLLDPTHQAQVAAREHR